MRRRQILVLVVLFAVAVAGFAMSATTTYPVSQGATWKTDRDLVVRFGSGFDVQSGNPFNVTSGTPFDADGGFRLHNATFAAEADANVTVERHDPVIETSDLSTNFGAWLAINDTTDDDPAIQLRGSADQLDRYQLNTSRGNDTADVYLDDGSASDQTDLRFRTPLTEGETLLAVDNDTDTVLDSTKVFLDTTDGKRYAVFKDLPAGSHQIDFVRGPSVLSVYNETRPTQLVDENVSLRVRFFTQDGETVEERQVTDGTVPLQGLPTGEEIVVTVDGNNSKYEYRRIILESLYQQRDVYLLPSSQPSIDVVFALNDKTGEFDPQESRLFVEAPVRKDFDGDGNNETRYVTIVGDHFGADGRFPAVIRPNERYRLRVVNDDGQTRVLGAYSAANGGIIEVPIGSVSIDGRGVGEASFGSALVEDNGTRYVRVRYEDSENLTSELDLEITSDDGGGTIRPNSTEVGPFGTYTETYQLPASAPDDVTYEIRYHAERDNRRDAGGTRYVGSTTTIFDGTLPVNEQVLSLVGWVSMAAFAGGLVIVDDRIAALGTVGYAAGISILGVVSIPTPALGIAGAIAVLYNIGRFRR